MRFSSLNFSLESVFFHCHRLHVCMVDFGFDFDIDFDIVDDADNIYHTTQANECHKDECDGLPVESDKHSFETN